MNTTTAAQQLQFRTVFDRAVMAAYGFPVKTTESECVAELFKPYRSLAAKGENG